jgi:hypothetical protein
MEQQRFPCAGNESGAMIHVPLKLKRFSEPHYPRVGVLALVLVPAQSATRREAFRENSKVHPLKPTT